MRHRVPADAILLFLVLIWSFHFAVVEYLLNNGVPPFVYATLRVGIGSLLGVSEVAGGFYNGEYAQLRAAGQLASAA